ncbi:hypothetical protein PTUN_b0897 [Pseudoalteromonas tunicata]|nr:hypothetical protein PTUN_b0897 [Pseudoalteromonas tunicata]
MTSQPAIFAGDKIYLLGFSQRYSKTFKPAAANKPNNATHTSKLDA